MASTAQREHLAALMRWTIQHERAFHYLQRRPMRMLAFSESHVRELVARGFSFSADCSEYVTWCFKCAGLGDPTGFHYEGFGNTSSMWAHLPHYSDPAEAWPGALVVWGPGGDHHVACVLERGSNPLLASHGREGGPNAVRLHGEDAAQRHRERVFLSISHL